MLILVLSFCGSRVEELLFQTGKPPTRFVVVIFEKDPHVGHRIFKAIFREPVFDGWWRGAI